MSPRYTLGRGFSSLIAEPLVHKSSREAAVYRTSAGPASVTVGCFLGSRSGLDLRSCDVVEPAPATARTKERD